MSEICFQFGQCGNQLGSHFFDTAYETDSRRSRWFHTTPKGDVARCILVDSENKVISTLLNENKRWRYRKKNCIWSKGGAGNNWALGYFHKGPELLNSVLEALRLEMERCDHVRSFVSFLSSGGGTGSGVGSYIVENLKDMFPNKPIFSTLVIPSWKNETPIQFYNTVLSFSKMHQYSDVIMPFYNDFLLKTCSALDKDRDFKFDDLNDIISSQLAAMFKSKDFNLNDIISLPLYKILSFKSSPYILPVLSSTSILWDPLLKHLRAMLYRNNNDLWDIQYSTHIVPSREMNYYRSITNMVICNGSGSENARQHAEKYFKIDELYAPWTCKSSRFHFIFDERSVVKYPFATLISNSGVFNSRLDKIIEKAWQSYHMNAYIHHFQQYGLENENFLFEFINIENICSAYNAL